MYNTEFETAKVAVQCALFAIHDDPSMSKHTENMWGYSTPLPPMENLSMCQQFIDTNTLDSQYADDTKTVKFKLQCTEKLLSDVIRSTNDIKIALLQIKATVNDIEVVSLQQKSRSHKTTKNRRSHSR